MFVEFHDPSLDADVLVNVAHIAVVTRGQDGLMHCVLESGETFYISEGDLERVMGVLKGRASTPDRPLQPAPPCTACGSEPRAVGRSLCLGCSHRTKQGKRG